MVRRNPSRAKHVQAARTRKLLAEGMVDEAERAWEAGDPEQYYRRLLVAYRYAALADAHLEHYGDPTALALWEQTSELADRIERMLLVYADVEPDHEPPRERPMLRVIRGGAQSNPRDEVLAW